MSNRIVRRVMLIAVALLFLGAGEISQKEALANCWQPISYYREHYRLIVYEEVDLPPSRDVIGWEYVDCEGNYYSGGQLTCGSNGVYCDQINYECSWICN